MRYRVLVVAIAAVTLGQSTAGHAQAAASPLSAVCAVYAAAVTAVAGDTAAALVLDSTFAGVPSFAFRAYSGFARSPEAQGLALPDSTRRALAAANASRRPLTPCLEALARVRLVASGSLLALFRGGGEGWDGFRARYPGARGFLSVSQPLFAPDSASALVYVAEARDWLAGAGRILQLARDSAGRWVRRAEAFLWVS